MNVLEVKIIKHLADKVSSISVSFSGWNSEKEFDRKKGKSSCGHLEPSALSG